MLNIVSERSIASIFRVREYFWLLYISFFTRSWSPSVYLKRANFIRVVRNYWPSVSYFCTVTLSLRVSCLTVSNFKNITYRPDNGGSKHFWHVCKLLLDYTAQHGWRQSYSVSLLLITQFELLGWFVDSLVIRLVTHRGTWLINLLVNESA
jgi:hypothetical protein